MGKPGLLQKERATVYWGGRRRWLTKKAAYRAEALAIIRNAEQQTPFRITHSFGDMLAFVVKQLKRGTVPTAEAVYETYALMEMDEQQLPFPEDVGEGDPL